MTDDEFVRAIESCTLPNDSFRHRDHLRLAWLYLQRYAEEEAVVRMETSIRRFAARHGAGDKYHHTMTMLWMHLVAAAALDDGSEDFDAFVAAHPELLDKDLPTRFYRPALLGSAEARSRWVSPDLRPLPAARRHSATGVLP